MRPKIAFIVDIRRQNMIELLMYKALFELSPNRAEFLSRLFSRQRVEGLNERSPQEAQSTSCRMRSSIAAKVLNDPLVVSNSAAESSLEIGISPNSGQIDGAVSDDKLQPMPGVQAVLIPDKNRDRIELFKPATTDQTGHFTIRSIPPGDYKLFAWETLENFAYFDSDLIKQVESQGKSVHVNESSKLQIDVRVIPAAK